MGTNGFLLGAGASFELAMPLVDELTTSFKIGLLRNIDKPYYKCPEKIRSIAEFLLRDKELNYEEIIGRIEIEIQRNRSNELYQEWYALLRRYNEAIFYLILEIHQKNLPYINERLPLLASIRKYNTEKPLWIFSLNHDLLLEMICKYLELPIKYGFWDKVLINGLTFERLSRENMQQNQFSFFQEAGCVNFVKLHGALDLFVQGDKKHYLKLVNNESWDGIVNDLTGLVDNDYCTKTYGARVANEVTYRDDKGIMQFLRLSILSGKHKESSRIQHTMDDWFFKIFSGHINHVSHLYCIGYSFGDLHINKVLYEWVSFSENRKITIVDPNVSTIPISFKHLKEQFEVINMGFLQFLNQDSDKETVSKIKLFEEARKLSRRINLRRTPA